RAQKAPTTPPPKGTTRKVPVAMAIEKVHCNAAVPQPYLRSIELTNSVQPYCRLAIATMQTMPRMSWLHRLKASPSTGDLAGSSIISAGARGCEAVNRSLRSERVPRYRHLQPRETI